MHAFSPLHGGESSRRHATPSHTMHAARRSAARRQGRRSTAGPRGAPLLCSRPLRRVVPLCWRSWAGLSPSGPPWRHQKHTESCHHAMARGWFWWFEELHRCHQRVLSLCRKLSPRDARGRLWVICGVKPCSRSLFCDLQSLLLSS